MPTPTYIDLSLTFGIHPGTNDCLQTVDVTAVKASMRNILLAGPFDSPFNPSYGGNIRGILFELLTPASIAIIKRHIILALAEYEPRVIIEDLYVGQDSNDNNAVNVGILFQVIGNPISQSYNFSIQRVR